jgi:DNA-binding transcriptional LysR family regulator
MRFYYKQDRLKQLRAFCAAADIGSMSAAAARLHVSQPSVSLLVKALEQDLAVQLFERRGPRIRITEAGRILLDLSRPLVEGLDTLPQVFAERLGQRLDDHLTIGAGPSTMLYVLPDLVKRFADKFPNTQVSLRHAIGQEGMELLRANEADFVVGTLLEIPADVIYLPIVPYSPVLITPLGHPLTHLERRITLKDIAAYPLIRPPLHFSTWQVVESQFQQHMLPYQVAMEASDWEVILEYVERGLGIAVVTSVCLKDRQQLEVIALGRYFPERSYGLILRKGRHLSPAVRRFIEIVNPKYAGG